MEGIFLRQNLSWSNEKNYGTESKRLHFEEMSVFETRKVLNAGDDGLPAHEAEKRLSIYGKNELEEKKPPSVLQRLIGQFMDPLIYVLLAAGVISVLLGEQGDAAIIAAVVLLNAAVGVAQEGKAQKALESLKQMTKLKAVVKRDGRLLEIDSAELVPGDLVVLSAGQQVPADLRLIFTENLKTQEAALTGESVPVEKDADFPAGEHTPLGDRKNMAYMSTFVTAGRGEGIVTATGMETEIGGIAKMIHETPEEITPLQKRLGDLGTMLSALAVGLCAVLFIVAVLQKRDVGEMFLTAISLAVAAVPEGLPAVVTIVLALSVSRMARVNTIVRRLPSVETLGAVNVVCSDKTGTLTKNQMTVQELDGDPELLLTAFLLCNDARWGKREVIGDPTEAAFLLYADGGNNSQKGENQSGWRQKSGNYKNRNQKDRIQENRNNESEIRKSESRGIADRKNRGKEKYSEKLRSEWTRIAALPFDSERKRMTTVCRKQNQIAAFTKGAPDVILSRCESYKDGTGIHPLTDRKRRKYERLTASYSALGGRVLGAAMKDGDDMSECGMTFLGLAVLEDPVRPEAAEAVEEFRHAGVTTVMITGDHKNTALAVAEKLGIADSPAQCMTGEELNRMGDQELAEQIGKIQVFARVSSDHKVRIVQAFKAADGIVAMTGDGVNDAPSLKAADVGIAMGKNGTDVAKQAADIVLTDDNFATIRNAIEEGREIYANIKKTVIFLLSSNFGEIMTMFFAILFSLPSPLKASHILWINLITDSLPALALGTDVCDGKELMKEVPRKPGESLFARGGGTCTVFYGFLIAVISLTAFLVVPVGLLVGHGKTVTITNIAKVLEDSMILAHCQTYAFTVLGLSQLFHAVGMRDVEKSVFRMNPVNNLLMILAVVIGFALQIMVTEQTALVAVFQTVRLTASEWRRLLILAAMPLFAHELFVILSRLGRRSE